MLMMDFNATMGNPSNRNASLAESGEHGVTYTALRFAGVSIGSQVSGIQPWFYEVRSHLCGDDQ